MDQALYAEMFAVEQTHWWFAAKHRIVLDLLQRYLPRPRNGVLRASPPRVADLGCGCGGLLAILAQDYDVIGMDSSPEAAAFSGQRGIAVRLGFLPDQVPLPKDAFDAALLLDVLEHLDEDDRSVAAAAALLKDQGILICTVPAHQWLWTRRDDHHHHRRRYSWNQFHRLFERPGLRIELFSHLNTILFPLALTERLSRRLLGGEETTDLHVPPAPINRLFETLFASERRLLGRFTLPFGLSLVAVVRKTGGA